MVAILSSETFSSNDSLWSTSGPEAEKTFVSSHESQEIKSFEHRPLAIPVVDVVPESDVSSIEETQVEALQPLEEEQTKLPEETLSLTETQLNQQLTETKQEAEREVTARLKEGFESELQELKKQQKEFFQLLANSLTDREQLISQFTLMAMKVGTLLARTELCLDQNGIEAFIRKSIQATGKSEVEIFSIRAAESWRAYATELEAFVPEGVALVFDESLQAGDLILAAGEGGYFDLLEERLSDIEDQLNAIDQSTLGDEKSDIFQHFIDSTFNNDDLDVAPTPETTKEINPHSESPIESVTDDVSAEIDKQDPEVPSQTDRMTLEGEGAILDASDLSADKTLEEDAPSVDDQSEAGQEDH